MLRRFARLCNSQTFSVLQQSIFNQAAHRFSTSAAVQALHKDLKTNKKLLQSAQDSKFESLETDPVLEAEGLNQSGILIPGPETPAMLIEGVRFDELPVAHIKATPNNTIINITDFKGHTSYGKRSCGIEGFRNVKKSTNVAAQATALTLGNIVKRKHGLKNVRVRVHGIGVGRLPAIKGLQMAGLNIVSITDSTILVHGGRRPRKPKKR